MITPKKIGPVNLEVKEIVGAVMVLVRRLYAGMLLVLLALCLWNLSRGATLAQALLPFLFAVCLLAGLYQLQRWRMGRKVAAIQDSMRSLTWIVEEEKLVIETQRSRSEFPWREQKGCTVREDTLVMKNKGGMQYVMPIRALASKEEARETAAWIDGRIQAAQS